MIQPKELRIGNYIYFYSSISKQTKVLAVWPEWFCNEADQHDSAPIPLTPEVLEKCGFEVLESDSVLNITFASNGFVSLNTYTNSKEYWWLRYYQGSTNAKLKYLHQLQNLYFALTGEELEYKP